MIWTNIFKLPEPFASLVSEDLYNEERHKQLLAYCQLNKLSVDDVVHFSASDLIKPPRMRVLVRRHWDEIISDVASHTYRILGTAVHTCLRLSSQRMSQRGVSGYIAEERIFTHMVVKGQMVVVSGEPDLITPDGWIHDYKVAAVQSLENGVKLEWEQATNIYAWLRSLMGLPTAGILITFILRDWRQSQAVQEGYPPAGVQSVEAKLWSRDEAKDYVMSRLHLHLEAQELADDDLPECSAYEMWEKPEAWAVIREGGARAAKLYKGEDFPLLTHREVVLAAANADADIRNKKPAKKGEKPYLVVHRPGERTRCQSFCDARQSCNLYKEYASVAFGGN